MVVVGSAQVHAWLQSLTSMVECGRASGAVEVDRINVEASLAVSSLSKTACGVPVGLYTSGANEF